MVVPDGFTGRYGRKGDTWYWPEGVADPVITGLGWALVRGLDKAPDGTTYTTIKAPQP
jgi:hypothetical protein